jgi:hypothetical protein
MTGNRIGYRQNGEEVRNEIDRVSSFMKISNKYLNDYDFFKRGYEEKGFCLYVHLL